MVGSLLRANHRNSPSRWSSFLVGDPHEGATLFFEKKGCARCHPANGVGGKSAPDLGYNRLPQSGITQTVSAMWNHAPKMWESMRAQNIEYPDLDREDVANLLAFLYTARYVDEPGDQARGEALFFSKGCARCHGAEGRSSGLAPDLATVKGVDTPIAWAETMWNHAPKMETRMHEVGAAWPKFEGDEMNDLLAYVRGICGGERREYALLPASPERGRKVFQEKACIVCHSAGGKGGRIGPDLGPNRELPTSMVRFAGAMWNHSPEMWRASQAQNVARPAFDDRQLADLVAYLASISYFEPVGSAQTGAGLFVERGCGSCHGPTGEGSRNGPALRGHNRAFTTLTLATALWKDGPRMYRRTRELNLPWSQLAESDIGSLVSFLNTPVN
jgi:mono/diheme cytochrome c family protein